MLILCIHPTHSILTLLLMESTFAQTLSEIGLSGASLMQLFFSLMVAILFIQSGLDKVFNWKGEKDFYTSHFKDSLLNGTVPILMPVIMISELAAGFLSGIGLVVSLATGNTTLAIVGMLMAALSIVQLFFGQRVAKDYAGAATLVPYFFLVMAGLYFYLF